MKFASLVVLAALMNDTSAQEVFNPMAGFSCPPGPNSGWGDRGDSDCKVVAPPAPPKDEEVGGLSIGKCYQFSSKNFPTHAFRHRNGEIWAD